MRSRRQTHKKQAKPSKKWKIRISVIACFTLLQWGAMYGLDRYLQPSVTVATPVQAASEAPVVTPVNVPSDAVKSALSADQQHAAYTTADQHLVLADKAGTTFDQQMNGDVVYMQWLGNSNTLLYFVQGSYLDAWLLPLNSNEPVLIHEWFGKDRQVQNTYFSSYMEYLYVELENQSQNVTEVYKYDALGGISQLPLENVQISSINYDDKNDIMELTDAQGGVWKYEKDRLYRPDGSEVYQKVIVNHPHPSGMTSTLTPVTPTTGTDKTDPGKTEPGKTDPTKPVTGCTGTGTNGTGSGTGTSTGGTGTVTNGTGTGTTGSGVTTPCSGSTTPGTGTTNPPGTTGGTGTTTKGSGGSNNTPPANGGSGGTGSGGTGSGGTGSGGTGSGGTGGGGTGGGGTGGGH